MGNHACLPTDCASGWFWNANPDETPEVFRERYMLRPVRLPLPPLLLEVLKSNGSEASDQAFVRNRRALRHFLHSTSQGRNLLGEAVYYFEKDPQECVTRVFVHWELGRRLEGPPDKCHGGLLAALLDDACGAFTNTYLRSRGRHGSAMTAYLKVDYKAPTTIPGQAVCMMSLDDRSEGRKVFVKGRLLAQKPDGLLCTNCEAEALFVELKQPFSGKRAPEDCPTTQQTLAK